MQIVHKDENERSSSGRTDSMGAVICIEKISEFLEGECLGGSGRGNTRIQISRGIFSSHQERVWRRRREVGESSGVKEAGVREKDDRRVRSRI